LKTLLREGSLWAATRETKTFNLVNITVLDTDDPELKNRVRTLQIVAGTLLAGIGFFLAVVFLLRSQSAAAGQARVNDTPIITFVAVGFLILQAPLVFVVPGIIQRTALRQIAVGVWRSPPRTDPSAFTGDTAKLLAVRNTTLIIALAMCEGVAFFSCLAYLIEGHPLALGVLGVAVFLMLLHFPTAGRVQAWLDQQTERLALLRQEKT
jgi:hypothetical protein